MKKTKLLVSLAAITTAAITPVITLASCNKEQTTTVKAIPESMLDIQSNVLYGLKESASIDAYDTLVVPDDVVAISAEAFKDAFKEDTNSGSSIKTIVFNKNLLAIGDDAFLGCDAITRLDLSKMQDIKIMALKLGEYSFTTWKNSGGTAVLPEGITDMQKEWIKEIFNNAGLPKSWFGETQPEEQQKADTINTIIKDKGCQTFFEVVEACKDTIDLESIVAAEGHTYVWDQIVNRIIIIDSETEELVYGPFDKSDYELNENKWQLWKIVDEGSFDSYSQYSQYLKKPTETNGLTKTSYSFISGFDCGYNTDVKNVHYFYEKAAEGEEQIIKDRIIINTNSKSTNVDISAYKGSTPSVSDTIVHYGQMGELTVVTNSYYTENGKTISATVYDGTIDIADDANILMTYVRSEDVTLTGYKTGVITDEVYAETQDIADALKDTSGITVASKNIQDAEEYQETKEEEYQEEGIQVSYVIDIVDDATGEVSNIHYNTLTDLATAANAETNKETFTGKTIKLNKDYDMSLESSLWVPICNDFENHDPTSSQPYSHHYDDAFAGTFDGQGHTIVNFNTTTSMNALFGSNRGVLKNINFENCKHECTTSGGNPLLTVILRPDTNTVIENVHAYNCTVSSNGSSGFFVSWVDGEFDLDKECTIKNCSTDADCVAYNTGGNQMGGIVGQACYVGKLTLEDLTNNATVSGKGAVGGIIGQYGASTPVGIFNRCVNNGKITMMDQSSGGGVYAGGITGYHNSNSRATSITYTDCVNNGDVTSTQTDARSRESTSVGGFCGYSTLFTVKFVNCTNNGNIGLVEGQEGEYKCFKAAGFCAFDNGDTAEQYINCKNTGTIYATVGVGHFAGLLQSATQSADANCSHTGRLIGTRVQIPGETN